jgi:hypothetical protein
MTRWGKGVLAAGLTVVAVGAAVVALTGLIPPREPPPEPGAIWERCVADTDAGTAVLDAEQARNAALIAAVGQSLSMSPRAVTVALTTAMQESGLRNLDYGDLDSLGLFQQRPSQGWGTQAEVLDPVHASTAFYNALAKVPEFELMEVKDAAQAVQRAAYPELYAQHEALGRSFASALTGHSPKGLTCVFTPAQEPVSPETVVGAVRLEWGGATADQREAWALASWAVAASGALGVESVTAEDAIWDRDRGSWRAAEPDRTEPPGGEAAHAVVIQLA